MKTSAVVIFVAVTVCVSAEDDQVGYTGKLAKIDVEAVLNNQRVLTSYLNCLLDKGPCTPEGREAKKTLPEIYFTNCVKCSKDQKAMAKKTFHALISKKKTELDALIIKYDPDRKHEKSFLNWVNQP